MKKTLSYLHKLQFDPRLENSWFAKYLGNPRLAILILLIVIGIGTVSYISLPRRLNPEVKLPLVIVATVLPGAGPEDVESLVTVPLENAVRSLDKVSTVTSNSQDNSSLIQIEFNSGIDPDKAKSDVQSAVDGVNLPDDALDPSVQKIDFENQPVWTFALIGNGDYASLARFSKTLKDKLEDLPSIDKVRTGGLETQEVSIIIEPNAAISYGLNPFSLSQLVKTSLASFPSGTVRTENSSFSLAIDPAVTTIEDVRNLTLNLNGQVVPLSSVASISERSKPNSPTTYFASHVQPATKAIVFDVYKTSSANIDKSVADASKVIDTTIEPHKNVFYVRSILNSSEQIDKQFSDLIRDFTLTIVLVFAVLFVFLGARPALVSFFAVPLTFLITFTVMRLTGISLNFLSMFSLLLSLGLLVDDAIVVISAMTSYYRSGKFTPLETGILVWKDFIVAILTTTLTTVWAFVPLLLSTGIIGEFIKSIPIVVSSTLLASFFVAMFMTLPFMVILLRPRLPRRISIFLKILLLVILLALFFFVAPKGIFLVFSIAALLISIFITVVVWRILISKTKTVLDAQAQQNPFLAKVPRFLDHGFISFEKIGARYERILEKILSSKSNRRKVIIMVVIFSIFSYLLLPLGFVKNEFFPPSDQKNLYVALELPVGTNISVSEREAVNLLNKLRSTKDVLYVTSDIGQGFSDMGGTVGAGSNNVLFSLTLPERNERSRDSIKIAEDLRAELKGYSKGTITVTEVSGGPPAGADIQIKLLGEDLSVLDKYADKVVSYLKAQNGVVDPKKSIKEGTSKIVFTPQKEILAQNGIGADAIAGWLRTFASGLKLDSAKITGDKSEEEDITLRLGTGEQRIEDVYALSIPTQNGNLPLTSLGKLELKPNPTQITREDGQRTISVSAAVRGGVTSSEVNAKLEKYANSGLDLPTGYSWKTGGVNEENQNSINSILAAMLLSFTLILATMVVQFSSFRKAVIVMLVIPLSISGVFILFAVSSTPLSFPALIGVLALFGIVVKNSILIVDKITANEKHNMPFVTSIVDATESRLEPIALTTFATIMGLIPITLSDPLWRGLGGAIIAGLVFSGTIMLFFIPVVYYQWFNKGQKN